jgi:hypothetical protein
MISQDQVCILLPTLERDSNLRRVLDSLKATAPHASIVVATDPHDQKSRDRAAKYQGVIIATCEASYMGRANAWNTALRSAPASALAYVLGADDCIYRPDWLDFTLATLHLMGDSGVVGFDDGNPNAARYYWSTHWLATRDFLVEHNGGVMAPVGYYGDWIDVEVCTKAICVEKFSKCSMARVTHDWHGGKDSVDNTYRRGFEHYQADKKLFEDRENDNFPCEWEPIIV